MFFSKNIQLSRDIMMHDVHSSQTMPIYALTLPNRCQHMYVCLQALVHVKAAHAHVKPRSNVAKSRPIVTLSLHATTVQTLGGNNAEKLDCG